jgi:hypothetical protein
MPLVAPNETSPAIGNYRVGRGYISMKLQGESSYADMGNCTKFTFQVKPTTLDHYSSRVGVRKKDLTVITQLDATLTMTLEEMTGRNMGLALLGLANVSGNVEIDIMSNPLFYCSLQFTDTSAAGPQWQAEFPNVQITPENAVELIAEGSGNWSNIVVTGNVQFDSASNSFGRFTSYDL